MSNYMRFVAALAFVLALIAFAAWIARRTGVAGRVAPLRRGEHRLRIVETITVDAKHRAVLLRRDDTEHLILLGGATGLLIESGIAAPPEPAADARTGSAGK